MFVVVVDDLFSVIHAAVTDLDGITIKDFSKFVVFWGVLVYKGKRSVFDIGTDVFTKWVVVPDYIVVLSVFSFVSRGWFVV